MPRTARAIEAGMIYHVLNRGNGRMRLFRKPEDYSAFERILADGLERYPVELLTYCLMPNHWHLVMRPGNAESLGRLIGWVGVTHVRRYQEHYNKRGAGHLYQGRYKSFPVAEDDYFLKLCRYVEANPVRAKLVERADQWPWSGFARRSRRDNELPMSPWPIDRPRNWSNLVNGALSSEEIKLMRNCVARGRPLGPDPWVVETASRLNLGFTLRGPGRPRKEANNQ